MLAQVSYQRQADSATYGQPGYAGAVTLHDSDGLIIGYLVVVGHPQKDWLNHQIAEKAAWVFGLRLSPPKR
jgi:hypothetical protein